MEMPAFTKRWAELNLNDDDLFELQVAIMARPRGHPIIRGTDGLRKIRFSPSRLAKGKSGGFRVCYAYFPEVGIVFLFTAYPKSVKADLTAEDRKQIRQLIQRIKKEL